MRVVKAIFGLVFGLSLADCAHYTAHPLTAPRARGLPPPTALWVARAHLLFPQWPPVVVHKAQGLTPNLAAIVAVVDNPMLRALRAREAIASAQVLKAGLLPNPRFSYGVGIPLSGVGLTRAFQVGLGLPIAALVTRPARVRAARYHAQDVNLTVAWQEWQVAARAKALVYEVLIARRERHLLRHEVRSLRRGGDLLADGEAAGFVTVGVAGAARLALRQTELARLSVRRAYVLRLLQLKALLGVAAHAPLRLARAKALAIPGDDLEARLWLKGVTHRRLDLLALQKGYKSANAGLRAAIAGQFPAITFGVSRARDTSDINTFGADVGVRLPLFNRNQAAVAIAKASRRSLYRTYGARVAAAHAEVHRLVATLRFLQLQRQATRSTVAVLTHLQTLYRHALARHRIPALTYYRLLSERAAEELALLEDEARMDQLTIALETASGRFEWPRALVRTRQ